MFMNRREISQSNAEKQKLKKNINQHRLFVSHLPKTAIFTRKNPHLEFFE